MDRRATARRQKRLAAQKKKEKSAAEKASANMDGAWATVRFAADGGYSITELWDSQSAAEDHARAESQKLMGTRPFSVVFAAPVDEDQGYLRGCVYYANMRAVTGPADLRSVSLWKTLAEADGNVAATARLTSEAARYVRVGGGVQLKKKAAASPPVVPKPETKRERSIARIAKKRADKKAAKRGVRTEMWTTMPKTPLELQNGGDVESDADSDADAVEEIQTGSAI
jgi:hypothetical protein